jgi:hypothetical protein
MIRKPEDLPGGTSHIVPARTGADGRPALGRVFLAIGKAWRDMHEADHEGLESTGHLGVTGGARPAPSHDVEAARVPTSNPSERQVRRSASGLPTVADCEALHPQSIADHFE